MVLRVFAVDDADAIAPALVDLNHSPTRYGVRGSAAGHLSMDACGEQGRRDRAVAGRWRVRLRRSRRCGRSLRFADASARGPGSRVPGGEVDVIVGLQLQNSETAPEAAGENVDHGAVGGGEGGNPGIDEALVEPLVDGTNVAD